MTESRKKMFRCKFVAGDGAYQYRFFFTRPDPIIRFAVSRFVPMASSFTQAALCEQPGYREYQLSHYEGNTMVFVEI